ncbi:hypothetical protein ASZ90_015870 [hydrocarbon metagenome]|uniref:Uncharacterized protein n=1 Tax=hydrocarbon metagenome TaxID=938273 RepID=A0A0W8F0R3_9ZZZZ
MWEREKSLKPGSSGYICPQPVHFLGQCPAPDFFVDTRIIFPAIATGLHEQECRDIPFRGSSTHRTGKDPLQREVHRTRGRKIITG